MFFIFTVPAKVEAPKSDVIMFTNPTPPSFPAAAQPQSTPPPAPVAATPAPNQGMMGQPQMGMQQGMQMGGM